MEHVRMASGNRNFSGIEHFEHFRNGGGRQLLKTRLLFFETLEYGVNASIFDAGTGIGMLKGEFP